MTLVVRPARREDVALFYPGVRASFRAWVAEIDGIVEGLIGLVMSRPIACLVSVFNEPLRPFLRSLSVLRAIRRARDLCASYRGRIIAVQERDEPESPVILARLGFSPLGEVDGEIWHVFGG